MDINELQYVVGSAKESEPAYMRFYGSVDSCSTQRFNDEFLWLTECVKPSKIVIGINSEGGSVISGMGTYSLILNSPIETETIIEGLAASMGSILWAAGTRSYMRDYSLLMIHNPFMTGKGEGLTPDQAQTISAFRQQLETIYHKRFGLSKAKVKEIMDGEAGCDGTFFDAKTAVKAGIIPAENVIKTPKQVSTKVKNQIEGITEINSLKEIMASANKELVNFKPLLNTPSIPIQNQTEKSNTMNENETFAFQSVCAQLGLAKDSEIAGVVNRLTELQNAEKELDELKNSYEELKIQKKGADANLENVKNELTDVKNQLKVYQDAEQAQRDSEINAMVEDAIKAGKISAEAKEEWVAMAHTNLAMATKTLDSIQGTDKISAEIANNKENVEEAKDGKTEAEREVEAQITEAVGKDFKFRTLED